MLRIIYIFSAISDKFVDVWSIFMRAINPVIRGPKTRPGLKTGSLLI